MKKSTHPTGEIMVFSGAGQPLEARSYQVPRLKAGEVLVANLYTTLCGSDLHSFSGKRNEKTPSVLGHEIVGRVIAIDEQHDGRDHAGLPLGVGDIVTWSIFASDANCQLSRQGMPQKGDNLFKYGHALLTEEDAFHGGLAEYCILRPYTVILKVPEGIPIPVAATINCAIATVAGALRMARDIQGKRVLITGMGLLGVACAAMCKDAGACQVIAADVSDRRLSQAMLFGADAVVYLSRAERIPPATVDIAFDMSGSPKAMEMGLETLSYGGTAIWVGAVFGDRKLAMDAESIVRRLLTIRGLHNYNYEDIQYALDFMTRNTLKFPFSSVVEKEFPLSQAQQAFEYAISHKPLRVGIKIGE
ncbi:zinc-binding dehydrogenase [Parapedobacter deserti]|uniref:alcohol dehydrogenase n=1 Tax=Parapedobacter deserti TaxID=1912957 RepID=A0ABV7JI33_9SPHI